MRPKKPIEDPSAANILSIAETSIDTEDNIEENIAVDKEGTSVGKNLTEAESFVEVEGLIEEPSGADTVTSAESSIDVEKSLEAPPTCR